MSIHRKKCIKKKMDVYKYKNIMIADVIYWQTLNSKLFRTILRASQLTNKPPNWWCQCWLSKVPDCL